MIEVRNLSRKQDGRPVLSDVSFAVEKGRIWGLLGAEHSGKTTAVDLITGCLTDGGGQVLIAGIDMAREPERAKAHLGYMPAEEPLYGEMSVRRFLKFVSEARGMGSREANEQIDEIIRRTGLKDVADERIRDLSTGVKRFVSLAQALIGKPEALVLDEPTDGLNPKEIVSMRRILRLLAKDHAIVLASRVVNEVCMLCDRVTLLCAGRVVAEGAPGELARMKGYDADWHLSVKGAKDAVRAALEGVKGVSVQSLDADAAAGTCAVVLRLKPDASSAREGIFWALSKAKCAILEMCRQAVDLEEVILSLTSEVNAATGEEAARDEDDL